MPADKRLTSLPEPGPRFDGKEVKDGKWTLVCKLQSFPSGKRWGWFLKT